MVWSTIVSSKKLECGFGAIHAGSPSCLGFGIGGRFHSNFLASTVGWMLLHDVAPISLWGTAGWEGWGDVGMEGMEGMGENGRVGVDDWFDDVIGFICMADGLQVRLSNAWIRAEGVAAHVFY